MLKIPNHIEPVPRETSARLIEKQWRARVALRANEFAYALNCRWKAEFKRRLKKKQFTDASSTIAAR